jgi:dTDP-4-amino-4,6-dideoxygalactose transaminase
MKVPFLDLQRQHQPMEEELRNSLLAVLADSQFIMGPNVKKIEEEMAQWLGCRHAIACASGTDALLLALMALNIGPGDEVITTPFTFFATAGCIVRCGATPVFVDIDESFNIDTTQIKNAITAKTKAIIPVHLYGRSCDMTAINQAIADTEIQVIEDCAQAIGAQWQGQKVGAIGAMGCISFFPSKNLGGIGDGGMVTTNNDDTAEFLRTLRVHGAKPKYFHRFVGINSRLDEFQAAAIRVKLPWLNGWNTRRREIAAQYDEGFKNLPVTTPIVAADLSSNIYHQYVLLTERRDELLDHLQKNGVAAGVYYPISLHLQECFSNLGYKKGDMPVAERYQETIFSLPIFPEMTTTEINYVIATVQSFFDNNR